MTTSPLYCILQKGVNQSLHKGRGWSTKWHKYWFGVFLRICMRVWAYTGVCLYCVCVQWVHVWRYMCRGHLHGCYWGPESTSHPQWTCSSGCLQAAASPHTRLQCCHMHKITNITRTYMVWLYIMQRACSQLLYQVKTTHELYWIWGKWQSAKGRVT